ncbi:helix-turn-helix domain-containing protein [Patescibacteria group bacterium]|nr:helix-turn-helix domain-containing protein [Patescibacteria group bacterium]
MLPIGVKIKKARIHLDLTIRLLAARIGVSHSYLILIEKGQRHFPKRLAEKLAKALRLDRETVHEWYLEQELTRAGIKNKKSHELIKRVLRMTTKEKESLLGVLRDEKIRASHPKK